MQAIQKNNEGLDDYDEISLLLKEYEEAVNIFRKTDEQDEYGNINPDFDDVDSRFIEASKALTKFRPRTEKSKKLWIAHIAKMVEEDTPSNALPFYLAVRDALIMASDKTIETLSIDEEDLTMEQFANSSFESINASEPVEQFDSKMRNLRINLNIAVTMLNQDDKGLFEFFNKEPETLIELHEVVANAAEYAEAINTVFTALKSRIEIIFARSEMLADKAA